MAWSGGLASIRLPFDATGDDGRNYIDIGEEVPLELADAFRAGLYFHSGNPPSFPNGFDYWAIGITDLGALELVARYYTYASPTADPVFARQTLLAFSPPTNVDNFPVLAIGKVANYTRYGEGVVSVRTQRLTDVMPRTALTVSTPATGGHFGVWDPAEGQFAVPSVRVDACGTAHLTGLFIAADVLFGPNAVLATLPAGSWPRKQEIFTALGWNNGVWRCDVTPAGQILWVANAPGTTSAANNYLSISGISYEVAA